MSRFSTTLETKHILEANPRRIVIPCEEWRGLYKYDLYGFGDMVSFLGGEGWWLTNGCMESDLDIHLKKYYANDVVKDKWESKGFGTRLFVFPNKEDRNEGNKGHRVVVLKPLKKEKVK